ncbi:hypothetical protein EON76_02915 [bacterium]|nr:MAG: hypothetical protein EON76_02915 [bacterium]
MSEIIPDRYQPFREIRTNDRFSTFEGLLEDKKVFIKFAADPKLKDRIPLEARGLAAMQQLDPDESYYHVPGVIELGDNYIVTEWANGASMANDFEAMDMDRVDHDLDYLRHLYSFIDHTPMADVNMEDVINKSVDKSLGNLQALVYEKHVDEALVLKTAEYLRVNGKVIEPRATNGDLQPGNIMIADGYMPTIIDCESYRDTWPRHYNIVNLAFNYGARYPVLRDKLNNMLSSYREGIGISSKSDVVDFNVSAAMRSLQIIEERLTDHDFNPEVKDYAESAMRSILAGQLFNS